MKYGRLLVGAGALTAMGVLVAPGLASAHTAAANPSCTGLTVKVELYPADTPIKVTIDGNTQNFSGGLNQTFPWSETVNHTWSVQVIDSGFPFNKGGTQEACNPPQTTTTTTIPATTTTTPDNPTTTTQPETPTTTPETPTTTPGTPTTAPPTTTPGTPITQNLVTTTTAASSSGGGASSGGGSSSSGSGQLPSTGPSDAVPFAIAGIAALAGGSALVLVARRRGTTPS